MTDTTQETTVTVGTQEPASWEAWLQAQPEAIRARYAESVAGLKSALEKERTAAAEGAKALKKIADIEAEEQKRKEAQMTNEQRLQKERDDFKAQAEQATAKAAAKLLKSAVLLKAQSMGFEHPADAFALADLSTVTAGESGEYDEKAIEAALKPLTGRLPVKAKGDGVGTGKFPNKPPASEKPKIPRIFTRY